MIMRLPLVLAVVLAASPALAAETNATLSPLLDEGAAVHLSVKPAAALAVFRWARTQRTLAAEADGLAGKLQGRLGFDVAAGLAPAGLADDAPVLLSIGAFEPAELAAAFRARADRDPKAQARAPRVWIRSRLVASSSDEKRTQAAITQLAAGGSELVLVSGPAAGVAAVFLADVKQGKAIAAALRGQKVLAVARVADGLLFVRVTGKKLILDHLVLFGSPVEWKRDGAAIAKLLARRPAKKPLAALEPPLPWTARPVDPAFLLAVDPLRLLELGKAGGYTKVLAAGAGIADAAQARSVLDTGEKEVLACDDFRPLASEGPLASLVVSADFAKGGLELQARWALRAPGVLDAALATSDDAIVDLAAAKDARLLFYAPLAGTRGLRELPRPGVLAQGDAAVGERSRLCGWGADAVTTLFGWLHAAGAGLNEEGTQGALWKAARNLVIAIKSLDAQSGRIEGVVLASVEGTPLHAMLDGTGKRGKASAGKRKLDRWTPARPDKPAVVATPARDPRHTIYGYVFGGDATLAWWWSQPTPPAAGGPAPFVALLRADLPWLGANAEKIFGIPGVTELSAGLGAGRGLLTLVPGELRATLAIDVK
jgi:hypothetical protein